MNATRVFHDPRDATVIDPIAVTLPVGTTVLPLAMDRLQQHKMALETAGVTDLSVLGNMKLSGPIIPQIGIAVPAAELYEVNMVPFQHAYKIDADGTSLVRIGGIARQLKARPFWRTTPGPVLSDNFGIANIRTSLSTSRFAAGSIPVDAYIAANTLELADNTEIILKYPNRYLCIIAEKIIVGKNVTVTWERPLLPTFDKPGKPEKKPPAAAPFWDDGTTPGLWGVTGETGTDGIKGFEDDWGRISKGVLDGSDAPEIELWALSLQGRPVIDAVGQTGGQGGSGGDGGDGGDGSRGWDAELGFLGFCKRSNGAGGKGGDGGKAGDGGRGGDGGHGGRFFLYAPWAELTKFAQGFLVKADGGGKGQGGMPGTPGEGGAGGQRGDNPRNCQPDRSDGQAGERGPLGQQGAPGQRSGGTYDDAIQLHVIEADEFRRRLLSPALISLKPQSACEGELVTVEGLRFTATDELLVDGMLTSKTAINDTKFAFIVPSITGGRKTVQVRQSDGTLSNRNTLAVLPKIITSQPSGRVRPGSSVILRGSGFSPAPIVVANGQLVQGAHFIDANTLGFMISRPSNIEKNPAGEMVALQVFVPEVEPSNTYSITLDTVRIAVFGDSILWGQGLTEQQKIHTKVAEVIQQREGDIGVYCELHAHSGAIIGIGNTHTEDALHGEIPTDYPTILQQTYAPIGAPESVDLILVNGGINDINVRRILNPAGSDSELSNLTKQHCYMGMKILLEHIAGRFKNAKIIVTGYYPMLSEMSNLSAMAVFLGLLGVVLSDIDGELVGGIISEVIKAKIVARAALFAEEAEMNLQRAIDDVNFGMATRRILLAQPEFGPEHAALASDSQIFGIGLTGTPEDHVVAPGRGLVCEAAPAGRTDAVICKVASMGHPNGRGAQAYADEIAALIREPSAFPTGFLWGVATAGYQVEGNITTNDWHIFTTSPAIRKRVQNLARVVGQSVELQSPGIAVKHEDMNALQEDLDRVQLLGMNSYRFSIEWSRVEPAADTSDSSAWEYYDKVIEELQRRDLKPIVTLNHLTLPGWVLTPPRESSILSATGLSIAVEDDEFRNSLRGWETEQTIEAFLKYVHQVVSRYKNSVDTWITFNEPVGSMIGVGYIGGIWSPGFSLDGPRARKAYFNILKAHVRAYNVIKQLYGQKLSRVGIAHAMMYARLTQAGGGLGNINEAAKNQFNYFYNEHLIDSLVNDVVDTAIHRRFDHRDNLASRDFYNLSSDEPWSRKLDFVGLNYYRSVYVYYDQILATFAGFSGGAFKNNLGDSAEKHRLLNDLGWEIYPKGIYHILKLIHERYSLPVLITENGIAQEEDYHRAPYIVAHLDHIQRAMQEGVQVDGYIHWTIVDNFEWHEHYRRQARFGLFTVDRGAKDADGNQILPRHITEGALALQYIIAENSLQQASEKFGCITAGASGVSPPVKSAGSLWVWDNATADDPGLNFYLSRLSSGRFLGMLFLQETHTWRQLKDITWDGTKISFTFNEGNGKVIQATATSTHNFLQGTMTGYPQPRPWRVKREPLSGNWTSTTSVDPSFVHFAGLEGIFGGWQSKSHMPHPRRRWIPNEFTQVGNSIKFDVGLYGKFSGNVSSVPEALLSGEITLVGGGGGATIPWQARRLPDDVP